MTYYERGRRFEYKAKKTLEQQGYSTIRAASSKGLWDIMGVCADDVLLVQVKSTKNQGKGWRDSNVAAFEALAVPANVRREVWVYRMGVGKPEIHRIEGKENAQGNDSA